MSCCEYRAEVLDESRGCLGASVLLGCGANYPPLPNETRCVETNSAQGCYTRALPGGRRELLLSIGGWEGPLLLQRLGVELCDPETLASVPFYPPDC